MSVAFKIAPTPEKLNEISSTLTGYWQNDTWYVLDPFFDTMRPEKWNERTRNINFNLLPIALRDEVKYFFVKRLTNQTLRFVSVVNYSKSFFRLAEFINNTYPNATSFVDIPLEKAMTKWRSYLLGQGMTVNKDGRFSRNYFVTILRQLCSFFENYYDIRDEFEKDIWDLRNIPGAKFNEISSEFYLNFSGIPKPYLNLVKRYIKTRVGIVTQHSCANYILSFKQFLGYINERYPNWTNLQQLSRNDMESYFAWFRQYNAELQPETALHYLVNLRTFFEYIQRADYSEAPITPAAVLIWKEDMPKLPQQDENNIKFIPEGVLCQLEDNLEHLEPEHIPKVILLRASGWRISDILNLRYDSCLDRTAQGWWLCGDIPKVQVLNHRVPITDEVAAILQALAEEVKEKSTLENNPKHYLFVRLDGKRKGLPPDRERLCNALNRLASKYNIVDDQGNLFHFKNHAFRHTKGVELINNGMKLLHVQKWLAHASPEMTLRYAKIFDNTMRKSWEEAMKNGAFRLDADSKPVKVDISSIENEDIIEWEYIRHNLDAFRMPLGYCLKPKKIECKHQLNPCLTCRNLCTTPDFIPQYEIEVREVRALIERGKAQNQTLWVEKNQHLLERYEDILSVLKEGKAHHLSGKRGREYVGEERKNVNPSA